VVQAAREAVYIVAAMNGLDAKVRDLFDSTIPEGLAKRTPQGEGFRCRFHIGEVGAWEIDLRQRPRCIDAQLASGGYDAVVYVSVEDFWSVIESEGAKLDELVASGRLRTTGDAPRALEMTKIVALGPPFDWPSSLRVLPVTRAFFGATEDDLLRACPGWRRSLLVPVMRQVKSPFTGEVVESASYDPSPGEKTESNFEPLAPPFPFVLAPMSSEWWEYLLDFYIMLVPGDHAVREVRDDDSLELWEMTDRVFRPVFSGRDARSNVFATPRSLATALSLLSDDDSAVLAARLATQVYPEASRPNPFTGVEQDYRNYRDAFERDVRRNLHDASDLARSLSPKAALWFWGWLE